MRSPGGMLPVSISKGLCVAEGQCSLKSRPIHYPTSGYLVGHMHGSRLGEGRMEWVR
jgi:hypothetical protein